MHELTDLSYLYGDGQQFAEALVRHYPHITRDSVWCVQFAMPLSQPTKSAIIRAGYVKEVCERLGVSPEPLINEAMELPW